MLAGFESQEAFARAFKQAFGLTQKYRGLRRRKACFSRSRASTSEEYLQQLSRNDTLTPSSTSSRRCSWLACVRFFYSVDSEKNNIGELPRVVGRLRGCPKFHSARRLYGSWCSAKRPTASASCVPRCHRRHMLDYRRAWFRSRFGRSRPFRAPRSGSAHRPYRELRLRQLAGPVQLPPQLRARLGETTAPRITPPTTTRSFTTQFPYAR